MRKFFTFLFAALMMTAVTGAWAQGPWTSGDCTVTLSDGTLTISGTGAMADYASVSAREWHTTDIRNSITSVVVGSGVTHIGNSSFRYLSNVTSVTLNEGLQTIGNYAFQGCNNAGFTSITIPASVTSIGNYAFSGCNKWTSVTFSDGSNLTTIGNNAFQTCSVLGSINIPASVTSIGQNAFYSCTALATITLNSNPSIGANAFTSTTAVTMNLTATPAGGANWMTFYNQNYGFEADANTEVFKVVLSGTELTLNKVDNGIVDAGTAVVLKTTGGNPVMTLTTSASGDTQDNSLTGVSAAAGVTSDGTFYVLDNGASGLGFYKLASGNTVGVGNAYLTSDSESDFFCLECEPAPTPDFSGEGTEVSPYLIATAEDWNKLATRVSEGNPYTGEYFQLTNNIAISTMVGLSDHNFNGIFDGAGHTITATLSSNAACCAPFAYTYGATIKNLHTSGTITTTGDNAGGVVGRNGTESLTLTNVSSDMTINSTKANGGLVGYTINATISGCAFTGKLLSESSRRICGLVGWKSNTTGSHLTITDCVFDPEEVTNGNSSSKTFVAIGGGTVTITNCYYTQAISTDQGKLMHAITAGTGVLVLNTGSATIYNVSGITSYGKGISYNNVLYGGNGDEISLNLSGSENGYEASTGTLSGTENPYTLTMADADCQINKLAPAPTTYTLQLVADPEKGSVEVTNLLGSGIVDNGNGNYTVPENAEVTILATPLEGYEFSGWKVGNSWCDFTECGTALNTNDNPLTFTMTEDAAYLAEFAAVTPQPEPQDITPNVDPQDASIYYSTFYDSQVKYALPAGVEAYIATRDGANLLLSQIAVAGQTIPADNAVILKSTVSPFTLTPSDADAVPVNAINSLQGSDDAIATPANCYVLAGTDGVVGFYHYTAANLNAHKAYVIYSGSSQAPRRMPFIFDQATGVENVQGDNVQSTKVIENGVLYIIKNGVKFNAQGQVVK